MMRIRGRAASLTPGELVTWRNESHVTGLKCQVKVKKITVYANNSLDLPDSAIIANMMLII